METLENKFKQLGLNASRHTHAPVLNVEEMVKEYANKPEIQGLFSKNMFLKDKKGSLFLVSCMHDRAVNLKTLQTILGAKELRFADAALLQSTLGVAPGSVSPLAIVNDKDAKVQVVLDKAFQDAAALNFHPLDASATWTISGGALKTFLDDLGYAPKFVDLDAPAEAAAPAAPEPKKGGDKKAAKKNAAAEKADEGASGKVVLKESGLGLDETKEGNFAEWYTQVLTRSEMLDYYDISGCYILRPWAFAIWEFIQSYFDGKIKASGVQNCYFPMFVSEKALMTEKDHVEGFAPEVAWVTKSGSSDLAEKVAIRPTSETVMYPSYARWIRGHRDLPLRLNQWCNVVRWEFKQPTPFLRTREFLWQEGHTAHATSAEAKEQVYEILDLYRSVYEDLLAVPVVKGIKTEKEKFAGGDYTTTVEGFIPSTGRGIQAATSHGLGQNFAKMFNIVFENENKQKEFAWQTSWGITTRSIGIMVMIHSDNKGLVLPPRIAPQQVVLVPIFYKTDQDAIIAKGKELISTLTKAGIRATLDDRTNYLPGWKFNHWELKGVPIRIELGSRDLQKNEVVLVRRDTGVKTTAPMENLAASINHLLDDIQSSLFAKAKADRDNHIVRAEKWAPFYRGLQEDNMVLCPWCDTTACEESIKERTKGGADTAQTETGEKVQSLGLSAKSLCKPLEQDPIPEGTCCFACSNPAKTWVLFGRSY
eukprot:TRINITY_DN674_c0_g1::TRINITY_DN674_c0_g1_i1::g.28817::m.28817 TRINITY_DN674_c0_g1::TRINITY_DN674_c0_g1_i1::g.28817  ORF type:complete len:743 (+),score=297.31,sp/O60155/PRS1_SCHPO/52.53/0.0,tRNA_edit/PF04073.10/1.5e-22,ProRS-C_1/PF09180.6/2.1e-20,tRNA-synt_2b/PF00587.20/1.4e-19,HGTP_anticodon/PF03129.15/2.2e-16 TRINITY_DN674_c0_g1_i1:114-2231(+)